MSNPEDMIFGRQVAIPRIEQLTFSTPVEYMSGIAEILEDIRTGYIPIVNYPTLKGEASKP